MCKLKIMAKASEILRVAFTYLDTLLHKNPNVYFIRKRLTQYLLILYNIHRDILIYVHADACT